MLQGQRPTRRTLTGAWIETGSSQAWDMATPVAPSRVRGLKLEKLRPASSQGGRTLTGAWIETVVTFGSPMPTNVAPSRVRGLKLLGVHPVLNWATSHSHGCVD